jgi:hypothetical protein
LKTFGFFDFQLQILSVLLFGKLELFSTFACFNTSPLVGRHHFSISQYQRHPYCLRPRTQVYCALVNIYWILRSFRPLDVQGIALALGCQDDIVISSFE